MSTITLLTGVFLLVLMPGCVPADAAEVKGVRNRRTINIDSHFLRWPDRTQILYYLDSSYSDTEKTLIRLAAKNVAAGAKGCVSFTETNATDTRYKVKVTPNDAFPSSGGVPYCYSYPGKLNPAYTSATEQSLVLTHGTNGCLDSKSVGELMGYFTILLGRRNEHERGDRDQYITVNDDSLTFPAAYRLYSTNDAYWSAFPYDYCSITHTSASKFAKAGTVAFTVNTDPKAIPALSIISSTDCQLISLLYGCDRTKCDAMDCTAARQQALAAGAATTISPTTVPAVTTAKYITTTVPPTTTTVPTTTASVCPLSAFCNASPDESAFLLGPYQQYQTYLLFSGNCVMEYLMNWTSGGIEPQLGPKLITEYFPSPGGPTAVPPVTLAYMTLESSGAQYKLNMQNQADSKMLQCTTNPAVYTNAADCPTAVTSTGIISTTLATSATAQLNIGNGSVYHFAVDKSGSVISLMDQTLTTTYEKTDGFLSGQSKIAKITAIQLVQDILEGIHPPMLMVFGLAADNATPYVGYVQMPLDATEDLALSPITWMDEPELMKTALKGC